MLSIVFSKTQQIAKYCCLLLCLNILLSGLFSETLYAQQSDELEAIQQQIKNKQQQIQTQLAKAKNLSGLLKKAELEIGTTAQALNRSQGKLSNNQREQQQLNIQQKSIKKQLDLQQTILAKQLRSAFMTGNYDYAKMLLNQQDAAKFERSITYYQYLNKARKSQIDGFRALVKQLQQVDQDLLEKQQELEQLQVAQKLQKSRLSQQQSSRKNTLEQIQAAIQSDAARIELLQLNEQNLLVALESARQEAQEQEQDQEQRRPESLEGLSKYKGKLLLPTKGRLRRLFGDRRQGQVRWKGVLINGNAGSPVVAIHHGKVLYADWLRGFGLVTVLDHGDGYMSLYGHNQALLRQAGDTVEAGEAIALVGQSGGLSNPNLYFEIRHKGKPVNPSKWLKL